MGNKTIYSETFKVRAYETRPDGLVSLPSLCNYLQEAASNHAKKLSWSFDDMNQKNKMWVLHRLKLEIDHYPAWQEYITVKTWPSHGDTLRAFRDFILTHKTSGKQIGKAVSQWMILDRNKHRPVPIPKEILDLSSPDPDHVLPMPKERIKRAQTTDHKSSLNVHFNDLDLNRHANNVKYVEWMLGSLPNDLLMNNIPTHLDIEFQGECNAGQTIDAFYKALDYTPRHHCVVYKHHLKNAVTDKPIAAAELTLKHR